MGSVTAYTTGDLLYSEANWDGGIREKFAMLVMENHTSTSSLNTDAQAGKIRTLFGANRQTNGKYQQQLYLESTGWQITIRPTLAYSGGKKRNRGNAAFANADFIIENTKIIDHASVYSTRIDVGGAIVYNAVGSHPYSSFGVKPEGYCQIDNLTIEHRGAWGTQIKRGLSITERAGSSIGSYVYNGITAIGESMNSVLFVTNWETVMENKYKIGILKRQHGDAEDAVFWPERYNAENFIVGAFSAQPDGYTFAEWVNYLFDFRNEQRDSSTYPIP